MIRNAHPTDEAFLRVMLYEAAVRPGGPQRPFETVLADPRNARFVVDWGRPGDVGVIAEDVGQPIGAAWLRMHAGDEFAPGTLASPLPSWLSR